MLSRVRKVDEANMLTNPTNMLQVYSVPQRYFSSSRDSLSGAYVNRGASEFDLSRKPKRRDQLRGRFKLPYTVALTPSRDQSHLHTPASVNHLSQSSCNGTETWVYRIFFGDRAPSVAKLRRTRLIPSLSRFPWASKYGKMQLLRVDECEFGEFSHRKDVWVSPLFFYGVRNVSNAVWIVSKGEYCTWNIFFFLRILFSCRRIVISIFWTWETRSNLIKHDINILYEI